MSMTGTRQIGVKQRLRNKHRQSVIMEMCTIVISLCQILSNHYLFPGTKDTFLNFFEKKDSVPGWSQYKNVYWFKIFLHNWHKKVLNCNYLGTKECFWIVLNKIRFLVKLNRKFFLFNYLPNYLCPETTQCVLNRILFHEILCLVELNTKIEFFIQIVPRN